MWLNPARPIKQRGYDHFPKRVLASTLSSCKLSFEAGFLGRWKFWLLPERIGWHFPSSSSFGLGVCQPANPFSQSLNTSKPRDSRSYEAQRLHQTRRDDADDDDEDGDDDRRGGGGSAGKKSNRRRAHRRMRGCPSTPTGLQGSHGVAYLGPRSPPTKMTEHELLGSD